jgi:hypothetical protein
MFRTGKWILIPVSVLLSLLSFNPVPEPTIIGQADAVWDDGVTVVLNEPIQYASPGCRKNATVTYTGTVHHELEWSPDVQYIQIELRIKAAPFNCSEIPSMIFTRNGRNMCFSFLVHVPWNADPSRTVQIVVGGIWRMVPTDLGSTIPPVTAILEVERYHGLEFEHDERITMKDGTKGHLELNYTNIGNSPDCPSIEILNVHELEEEGISIGPSLDEVNVTPLEHHIYRIEIVLDNGLPSGDHIVELQVSSMGAGTSGDGADPDLSNFTLHVEGSLTADLGLKDCQVWVVLFLMLSFDFLIMVMALSSRRFRTLLVHCLDKHVAQ